MVWTLACGGNQRRCCRNGFHDFLQNPHQCLRPQTTEPTTSDPLWDKRSEHLGRIVHQGLTAQGAQGRTCGNP